MYHKPRVGDSDWGLPASCEDVKWCYFSGGGSQGSQRSRAKSEQGVSKSNRDLVFDQFQNLFSGPSNPNLFTALQEFSQAPPQLQLNSSGLTPGVTNLANNLVSSGVQSQFANLSGAGALRGQVNPENTSALIGSAAERATAAALPQFIQQAGANEQFNTLAPQQNRAQTLQFLQGIGGLLASLAQGGSTGQSSSSGSQSSFNFGIGGGLGSAGLGSLSG